MNRKGQGDRKTATLTAIENLADRVHQLSIQCTDTAQPENLLLNERIPRVGSSKMTSFAQPVLRSLQKSRTLAHCFPKHAALFLSQEISEKQNTPGYAFGSKQRLCSATNHASLSGKVAP